MDSETRQHRIVELARTRGRVEVVSLAEELDVASETIRRDLKALAARRLLKRVHGGAVPAETAAFESGLEFRSQVDLAQKQRIAHAAVGLLHGAETVYLDEGFTPRLIAQQLADQRLTVVTSSLLAAEALAHSSTATVLLLGGRMRGRTLATVDHWAVEMLRGLVIDVAFIGTNAISRENGLTTSDPAVAAVKSTAVAVSRRSILVAAHSKFGLSNFCRFADVPDFEAIVTGSELGFAEAKSYEVLGPTVLRV
ncbi:DeoR family transcriptional regulator [Gordonia amarae]|uniref:Lactose phosphotransferase system repressor n=1 Tax=Gordonia amarae TaxID=36821 RepID=A0A857KKX2_9ACTN|nr:DeoR/GlpR family DNA-binding transcription regulator [Gordonia amarae]MCS3879351.1 DeoR/GlpR family transcriptional regulator of sugar metabolism [Gordonia amarae]QHN17832.1 DeoR family transcriptional regulator [Gordonia amarae]QHN22363.1 DeoR family transcriptional regulator [Gordonia amarae]QHN31239.1 DeoR family transcriptional regulator [Gordonia amarae]QHN39984.1 DeoR family transcriptional regulator [Gordonia amarae]